MNITLISGSFDVLHAGHVQILNFAKSLGDLLFVAVDSDERIAQKKGPQRPFNSLKDRIYLLKNLKMKLILLNLKIWLNYLLHMIKKQN
jgi:D-beta-D-heptose 7-phosphate kinase/D-beta-D-heptose 1-phosphate adenosyltransferase